MGLNFDYATSLKKKLDGLRPLNEVEVARLREYERLEMVYTSNALEGNTLTEFETKLIIEEGLTISGKSMKEHLEVVNLNEAIDFVEDLVRGEQKLDERTLKEIHYLVFNKLTRTRSEAGIYRIVPVRIGGSQHTPPAPSLIQDEMNKFFEWNREAKDKLHPIEYAALLHEKFVTIHPFVDGNGRTARLLMNFGLTSKGYPPIVIKPDAQTRTVYNKTLEHSQITGDTEPFIKIVKEITENKLESMIEVIEQAHIISSERKKAEEEFLKEMDKKYSNKKKDKGFELE